MNQLAEMNKKVEKEIQLSNKAYDTEIWDKLMRGLQPSSEKTSVGKAMNGMFELPMESSREYQTALKKESFFRNIATCVDAPRTNSTIWISDSEVDASFVEEGAQVSTIDVTDSLMDKEIKCNKVAVITAYRNDLVSDIGFDVKRNLITTFARGFNRAKRMLLSTGQVWICLLVFFMKLMVRR